jgi:hypothetical protein
MMKYGADKPVEHQFTLSHGEVEKRGPWIDIYLIMHLKDGQALPEDLQEPGILIICNLSGDLVQIVLQNEGIDCEFQLTYSEKAQIEQYFEEHQASLLSILHEV